MSVHALIEQYGPAPHASMRHLSLFNAQSKAKDSFEGNLLASHISRARSGSSAASLISLMCKACESETISDYTGAVSWYKASLAFLKASDPNEIEVGPLFRAHIGIGDNMKKLHRLDDAEKHYEVAVKYAKGNGDKKGLEEAARKLGKTYMEHSTLMDQQGLSQEAYTALQRGIMCLEDAMNGKVDNEYHDTLAQHLGLGEKILHDDAKIKMIGQGRGGAKDLLKGGHLKNNGGGHKLPLNKGKR